MKDRIISNWKSTFVGLFILIACFLAIIFKYATLDEVIGFMTLSGLLAWVKDTIFKVNPE